MADEAEALSFALSRPVAWADVDVTLTDSTSLHDAVSLLDPLAAIVRKTLAWNARVADKDVTDVHRCLAVARRPPRGRARRRVRRPAPPWQCGR